MTSLRVAVVSAAVLVSVLAGACSSEPAQDPALDPSSEDSRLPTTAPATGDPPTSNIVVSDAVPTLDELKNLGIGEQAAQCFITTIDPDGTGRVASAELFAEAFAACL